MEAFRFGEINRACEETTSTQDDARALVERDGASAAGVVCSARYQSAGRGRQGRTWYAPPGANVIHTYIGRPVALAELWQVAFVAAVAVADAVAVFAGDVPVRLRFPNDLLLRGKKVSGVLVETATGADVPGGFAMPLIGIGINVLGAVDALPPEVAVRATTLQAETGTAFSVGIVGGQLAQALTHRWNEWRTGDGIVTTLAAWHGYHDPEARRMFTLPGGETALCRVVSVAPDGMVVIELPDGSRRVIPVAHVLLP
ncbi:MAG: biotin--[acetyl-CoA-carboxylase] ligase [Armatimonadetes bacterium]|nr:biotin--[acetyl-CoA-carboxylase] ligase [Armatimonadota bacterium]